MGLNNELQIPLLNILDLVPAHAKVLGRILDRHVLNQR